MVFEFMNRVTLASVAAASFFFAGVAFCQQEAHRTGLEQNLVREPVPAGVLAAAVPAVQELGNLFLQKKYQEVVDKTYPRMLKKMAKREPGGEAAVMARLQKRIAEVDNLGVTLLSFEALPAINGLDIPENKEWLVVVPIRQVMSGVDPETGKIVKVEIRSFQLAICTKDGAEWSFLTGSNTEVSELRTYFSSMPRDFGDWALPKVTERVLPEGQ